MVWLPSRKLDDVAILLDGRGQEAELIAQVGESAPQEEAPFGPGRQLHRGGCCLASGKAPSLGTYGSPAHPRSSIRQGDVKLRRAAFENQEQASLGVLLEIGSGSVGIERGLIVVLLVKKKPPRVGRRPVCQIHPATGLGARVLGHLGEERDGFVFVTRFDDIR